MRTPGTQTWRMDAEDVGIYVRPGNQGSFIAHCQSCRGAPNELSTRMKLTTDRPTNQNQRSSKHSKRKPLRCVDAMGGLDLRHDLSSLTYK
ncbi:hypothetical protein EW146_g4370 [Bondarzewia mesenterica]|uniref:Uncharacterized protein n=1 Tax=Bondarzewia mesenterica TaxID=1095465 RepID=A0A4V3XF58_9AGAM|nr:hypothetical protein EW146_g4370 [Bondarzewia mesenterica]